MITKFLITIPTQKQWSLFPLTHSFFQSSVSGNIESLMETKLTVSFIWASHLLSAYCSLFTVHCRVHKHTLVFFRIRRSAWLFLMRNSRWRAIVVSPPKMATSLLTLSPSFLSLSLWNEFDWEIDNYCSNINDT